ncbi:hypothetical protein RY27_23000, partial [Litorilinea aerophila]
VELLHRAGLVKSKSEGRRLIQQGGVRINGETVADLDQVVQVPNGQELVIQAGKRKFLRVTRG